MNEIQLYHGDIVLLERYYYSLRSVISFYGDALVEHLNKIPDRKTDDIPVTTLNNVVENGFLRICILANNFASYTVCSVSNVKPER